MERRKVATFAERLNEAMKIRDKRAVDISRETGLESASISNWRHGKYEAAQTGIYLLARSLNVSEAWLMGYDVPMERPIETPSEFTIVPFWTRIKVPIVPP